MSNRKPPEPELVWVGSPGHAVGFGLLTPGMIVPETSLPAGLRVHPDWRARQNTKEESDE